MILIKQLIEMMLTETIVTALAITAGAYICVKVIEIFLTIKYWIKDRMVRKR